MVSSRRSLQVVTTTWENFLWASWESYYRPMESIRISYVSTILSLCEHGGTKDITCNEWGNLRFTISLWNPCEFNGFPSQTLCILFGTPATITRSILYTIKNPWESYGFCCRLLQSWNAWGSLEGLAKKMGNWGFVGYLVTNLIPRHVI